MRALLLLFVAVLVGLAAFALVEILGSLDLEGLAR